MTVRELRRFAVRSAVIPLAVGAALALAVVPLLAMSLADLAFLPATTPSNWGLFADSLLPGYTAIGGRPVAWAVPLGNLLEASVLTGLGVAAIRFRRARLRTCAECGSSVPVVAAVCCRCRKDLGS